MVHGLMNVNQVPTFLHFKNLENQEIPLFIWADSGLLDTATTFLKILMPQTLFKWQLPRAVFEKSSTELEDCSCTRQIYIALTKEKNVY